MSDMNIGIGDYGDPLAAYAETNEANADGAATVQAEREAESSDSDPTLTLNKDELTLILACIAEVGERTCAAWEAERAVGHLDHAQGLQALEQRLDALYTKLEPIENDGGTLAVIPF